MQSKARSIVSQLNKFTRMHGEAQCRRSVPQQQHAKCFRHVRRPIRALQVIAWFTAINLSIESTKPDFTIPGVQVEAIGLAALAKQKQYEQAGQKMKRQDLSVHVSHGATV